MFVYIIFRRPNKRKVDILKWINLEVILNVVL